MLLSYLPSSAVLLKLAYYEIVFIQKWHHLQTLSPIGLEVPMVYYILIERYLWGK